METFASGFAQGFIRARERSEDRAQKEKDKQDALALQEKMYLRSRADQKADTEDTRKYTAGIRLDDRAYQEKKDAEQRAQQLTDQKTAAENARKNVDYQYTYQGLQNYRETREAAVAKDKEMVESARVLSGGDSGLAGTILKLRKSGVTVDKIQDMIEKKQLVKDPNYVQPTQELKLPPGVTPGATDAQNPITGMPVPAKKKDLGEEMGLDAATRERIKGVNPGLLEPVEGPDLKGIDLSGTAYKYQPTDTIKVGSLEQELSNLQRANDGNDPAARRTAENNIKAIQTARVMEAEAKAKAEGTGGMTYFQETPNGPRQFFGRQDGEHLMDTTSSPDGKPLIVTGGRVIAMDKPDRDQYNGLVQTYGKASTEYDNKFVQFAGALDSGQQMAQLLHDDPRAASMVSKGLGTVMDLKGEAQAAMSAIEDFQKQIAVVDKDKNPGQYEALVAKQEEAVKKFLGNSNSIGAGNDQSAINAAKYNALLLSTANHLAQSMATDGKVSNADFDRAQKIIADGKTPELVLPTIQGMVKESFNKLKSEQYVLGKNAQVEEFERRHAGPDGKPFKTGLRPERIEQSVINLYGEGSPQLEYLRSLDKPYAAPVEIQPPANVQPQVQPVNNQTYAPVVPDAIKDLKAANTPDNRKAFDEVFGPGAAQRALEGK